MSDEIKRIQSEAQLNAKWDALNRKVLLIGENNPKALRKLEEWNEEFLQKWIDKALEYEYYNLVKILTDEQKRRKNE